MRSGNKLLLPVGGRTMVAAVYDTVAAAGFDPVIVVTGHEERAVATALGERPAVLARNPRWWEGEGCSIRVGVSELPSDAAGALLAMADMPGVRRSTLETLRERFEETGGTAIVYPTYEGRRGDPVLFPARFFVDLLTLDGDRGASRILFRYPEECVPVAVSSRGVVLGCDTEDDYIRLLSMAEV